MKVKPVLIPVADSLVVSSPEKRFRGPGLNPCLVHHYFAYPITHIRQRNGLSPCKHLKAYRYFQMILPNFPFIPNVSMF